MESFPSLRQSFPLWVVKLFPASIPGAINGGEAGVGIAELDGGGLQRPPWCSKTLSPLTLGFSSGRRRVRRWKSWTPRAETF